ncbi:MAG: response regulator transcription factor [Bradyrhizobium sp.]|nr:response regulator transcription factor [Bradyrhizobium sp.]
MSAKARIVLCDDHPIVLAGLRSLIAAQEDFELVGEATHGFDALRLISEVKPDVAVLDISMPQLNGILLARRLADECPSVRVMIMTLYEDGVFVRQAMDSGVRAYVLKRSAAENLVQAIRSVLVGGIYLDPIIARLVVPSSNSVPHDLLSRKAAKAEITGRESMVLSLAAKGFTNKEIGAQLDVSEKSVETYKARGLEKLGLKTRAELVRYASIQGWLADV